MIETEGIHRRTVTGYIESVEYRGTNVHRTAYRFIIRPKLWLLTLEQTSRIFHFKSIPDILFSLLNEQGIEFDSHFYDQHEQREYVTQKRENNYDFFIRLVSEEGLIFWFEGESLFLSDRSNGMLYLKKEIEYNPHIQAGHKECVVYEMSYTATMRPTEMLIKDHWHTHSRVPLLYQAEPDPREEGARYQYYDSYGRFSSDAMGRQYSRYRLESLRAERELGRGKGNVIELRPGYYFDILAYPNEEMQKRWQIVRVTHKGKLPQSLGKESGSEAATLTNEFTFIPHNRHWRLPYHYKPLADGDEVATVVGPEGEEIYVNKDGCVRVHFHWNRDDKADENASCWVRVAQGWNGNHYGLMGIPRIGQEVLISYLNGDIDRPLVTGTTYNAHNRPPLRLPQEKTQLVLRTKTHKGDGYNELRFEDEKDKEEIYIHAQKDMRTLVNNDVQRHTVRDEKIRIDNSRHMQVGADEHLNVKGERCVLIEKGDSLTVKGAYHQQVEQSMVLASTQDIHHQAGTKLVLSAATEITLKVGGSFISITPSGITASPALDVGSGSASSGSAIMNKLPLEVLGLTAKQLYLQALPHLAPPSSSEPIIRVGEPCAELAQENGDMLITGRES